MIPDDRLTEIEFFREAFILVPRMKGNPYQTVLIPSSDEKKRDRLFCSCSTGKTPHCPHAKRVAELYTLYRETFKTADINGIFQIKNCGRLLFGDAPCQGGLTTLARSE